MMDFELQVMIALVITTLAEHLTDDGIAAAAVDLRDRAAGRDDAPGADFLNGAADTIVEYAERRRAEASQ